MEPKQNQNQTHLDISAGKYALRNLSQYCKLINKYITLEQRQTNWKKYKKKEKKSEATKQRISLERNQKWIDNLTSADSQLD